MWGTISLRFWFAFPWWCRMLSTFSIPVGQLYVFFGKMSPQVFFPLKKFFFYWIVWVLCILWVLISYQVYGLSNEISKRYPFIKRKTGSSHVAWWGKDPALRQLWCRRQLQRGFDPWPGNFHMPQVWPRKKKEKQMPTTLMQILLWRTSANK